MFLGSYTLMLTMFAVYISSTSSSLNFSKYIISKINVIALRKLSITGRTLPTFCCHLRMWWCTPTAATSLPLERQDPGPRPPRPSPSRVPRPPASRPHRTWLQLRPGRPDTASRSAWPATGSRRRYRDTRYRDPPIITLWRGSGGDPPPTTQPRPSRPVALGAASALPTICPLCQ